MVTGGGRGIGKAIALRLASDGADIVIPDIDLDAGKSAAAEVEALGRQALAVRTDVSSKEQVQAMVAATLEKFGRVDILINNAGILGPNRPVVEIEEEEWDRVLAINLKGAFLCSQAVIPHMVTQGWGRIVSMSSVAGKEGNPNMAPYNVSKIGIIGLTKSLGKELAKTGVTVNCVAPTMIETELIDNVSEETMKMLLAKIPMGRIGKPHEVAALMSFLVSEEAGFITGQCYNLTGGRAVY
jgi:3-oxoacyl-[acyl-carrier protein] reductase